jgi:glycosyltransferase involved in cell wall biosynthesis
MAQPAYYTWWDKIRTHGVWKVVSLLLLTLPFLLRNWLLVRRTREERRRLREHFRQGRANGAGLGPHTGFVGVSLYLWDELWHRPQQTFWRVAEHQVVIYLRPIFVKQILSEKKPLSYLGDRLIRLDEQRRIWLFEPVLISGEHRLEAIRELNRAYLETKLYRLLREQGCERLVLWYNFPNVVYLAGAMEEAALVYDILDEYAGFSWGGAEVGRRERHLLSLADVSFAGTGQLYKRKHEWTRNMHFLPCGVDFEHFHAGAEEATALPEDLPPKSGPTLGYFGMVDERIDWDLLAALHERHPDWTVLLIGPFISKDLRFAHHERIRVLGPRPYAELPRYLKYWDVSLIPFVLNEVTRNINPTKLLEYLACGKPVVTPAIPDIVEYYSEVVHIARDHDEFIRHCEAALAESDPAQVSARVERARGNSWESFVSFVLEKIEDVAASPSADRSSEQTTRPEDHSS